MAGMSALALLAACFLTPAPSPAERARLAAHVGNLNHPRYAVREAATKHLAGAGLSARPVLREAAAAGDPETAARAKAALDVMLSADLAALRPLPEIDAYWYSIENHAYSLPKPDDMARCLRACGYSAKPWDSYYQATEMWVRERLAAGANPRGLRLVLAAMHARDAVFIGRAADPDELPYPVDAVAYLRGK